MSVDQLRALNGLTSDVLSVGQTLIIAKGSVTPTAGPMTTIAGSPAAPGPPTAGTDLAPSNNPSLVGTGTVCALLWNDADGDGVRNAGEGLVRSGRLTVVELTTGRQVQAYTTDGVSEPHCFNDLPAGEYTVSAAAPDGYGATTVTSVPLEVVAGSVTTLEFGARQQAIPPNAAPPAHGQPSMTGLAFAGGAAIIVLALLIAVGVASLLFLRRPR